MGYPVQQYRSGRTNRREAGLSTSTQGFLAPTVFPVEVPLPVAASATVAAEATVGIGLGAGLLLGGAGFALGVGIGLVLFPDVRHALGDYLWPGDQWSPRVSIPGAPAVYGWSKICEQDYARVGQGPPGSTSFEFFSDDGVCVDSTNTVGYAGQLEPGIGQWDVSPDRLMVRYADWYGAPVVKQATIETWHTVVTTPAEPGVDYPGYYAPLEPARTDDPFALPILKPTEVPTPKRFDEALPEPGTQPGRKQTFPEMPNYPIVEVPPWVNVPVQSITLTPGTAKVNNDRKLELDTSLDRVPNTKFKPDAPTDWPSPTRAREKERKIHVGKFKMWHLLNSLTEGFDFIDAMWKALPKDCKSKPAKGSMLDPYDKAVDLARCWQHLDVADAFANYVNNQIGDIVAAMQSPPASVSRNFGITTGLDKAISDRQKDIKMDGNRENDATIPVPTLKFNHSTDSYYWVWETA